MAEEYIQTTHVSLLRCSKSAVPIDQRFVYEPDENCETRSDGMDFEIYGCYSQRAAEIRNKVWILRGSEMR